MSANTKTLIAEARKTQGYSEGDLRSLVRSLADALQAAQATIAEALTVRVVTDRGIVSTIGRIRDVLSRADVSALAEHDRKVSERAWDEGYRTCDQVWTETADLVTPDEDRTDHRNPYRATENGENTHE